MIIKLYLLSEYIVSKITKYIHIAGFTICLPALTIVVGLDVFLRYAFNAPLSWGKEVGGLFLLLAVLLSMPYCWDKKRHVRMEVVYDYFKGKMKRFADIFSAVMGLFFFLALGIDSVLQIPYMIAVHETGQDTDIVLWPFRVVIAFVSFLFVVKLVFNIIEFAFKETEKEEEQTWN